MAYKQVPDVQQISLLGSVVPIFTTQFKSASDPAGNLKDVGRLEFTYKYLHLSPAKVYIIKKYTGLCNR